MPASNPFDLFLGIVILVLIGALIHLWLTVNRLTRTVRRLQDEVESRLCLRS